MSAVIDSHFVIAIFGANGNISSNVISHIEELFPKQNGTIVNYSLRIITRNPELMRHKQFRIPVDLVTGNIDDTDHLDEYLIHVNRAFFCLPQFLSSDQMVKTSHLFADSAKRCGVQTVVRISSYGMDSKSATYLSQGSLGKAHVEGEEYMRSIGLTVTSVRPTSFFSNFVKYDLPSIRTNSSFFSPLGSNAAVNWISCDDISAVVARALLDTSVDGRTLDITGPEQNTLSAEQMRILIQDKFRREIKYIELPVPESTEMNGLWIFLRAGGFAHHTCIVEEIIGRKPIEFSSFLNSLER